MALPTKKIVTKHRKELADNLRECNDKVRKEIGRMSDHLEIFDSSQVELKINEVIDQAVVIIRQQILNMLEDLLGELMIHYDEQLDLSEQTKTDIIKETIKVVARDKFRSKTLLDRTEFVSKRFKLVLKNKIRTNLMMNRTKNQLIRAIIENIKSVKQVPGGSIFRWSERLLIGEAHRTYHNFMIILAEKMDYRLEWVGEGSMEELNGVYTPSALPDFPHPYALYELKLIKPSN